MTNKEKIRQIWTYLDIYDRNKFRKIQKNLDIFRTDKIFLGKFRQCKTNLEDFRYI